jgi:hypothetical protein
MIGIPNQLAKVEIKYLARVLRKLMDIGNWQVCFQRASRWDASGSQPNRLRDAQIVGHCRLDTGLGPSVSENSGKLYVNLNSPNTPEVGLVPEGGDQYRLEGYPDDFTAAFSATNGGEIQLKVYLSRWPPTIAYK